MNDADSPALPLSSRTETLTQVIRKLERAPTQEAVDEILFGAFGRVSQGLSADSNDYYEVLNLQLHRYIEKCYAGGEPSICLWRFIKILSPDQLAKNHRERPDLAMLDRLIRMFFYSGPLDDLTCLFIPINDEGRIRRYLEWIKSYFYDANYPTSLLWLYALDSSLSSLFPDEIIYLGKSLIGAGENIRVPDFDEADTVLLKRFSARPDHYLFLEGREANNEFRQIFTFLEHEYQDRCLCRSGRQEDYDDPAAYRREWEKFQDVLRFGVSDKTECGCVSFSDMRASTEFLNTHGKLVYLNKIQQPFFEQTKLISKKYHGRIDKFMGDNVMCVFLDSTHPPEAPGRKDQRTILNIFFSLFGLCKILSGLIERSGLTHSRLGLRSGVTYGDQILRSNLGNEIVRDFTVTGETVNLAARLEHISIRELVHHNEAYFKRCAARFPQISELIAIGEANDNLNPETRRVVNDFALYQNITSNLERLESVRFDIRCNQTYYFKLREHFQEKGFPLLNPDTARLYGYEEYDVLGFSLKFYYSYYNPKGFSDYETIWILPLSGETLRDLDIEGIR